MSPQRKTPLLPNPSIITVDEFLSQLKPLLEKFLIDDSDESRAAAGASHRNYVGPEEKGASAEPAKKSTAGRGTAQAAARGVRTWADYVEYAPLELGTEVIVAVAVAPHRDPDCPFDFVGVVQGSSFDSDRWDVFEVRVGRAGKNDPTPYVPQSGEVVLAPFQGSYYRAVAVSETKMWFLDYGNVDEVAAGSVRRVPDEILSEPPLSHLFRLAGGVDGRVLDGLRPSDPDEDAVEWKLKICGVEEAGKVYRVAGLRRA